MAAPALARDEVGLMGGVVVIARHDGEPLEPTLVDRMLDRSRHRGPDGARGWVDSDVGLGQLDHWFRREDEGHRGPYVSDDVAVAADCRLDNRPELTSRLGLDGHESDGAVIAAAFRRWGDDFARTLLGDFAVAVVHRPSRRLLLVRDAMGMRPLHLWHQPGRQVVAATDVGQILAAGGSFHPDREAMAAHLHEYPLPLTRSFVAGIDQVAPGELVVIGPTGSLRRSAHWEPDVGMRIRLADEVAYAEGLRELLLEAVRTRCDGRRPTGLMLSGGVDSGVIAATAGHLASTREVEPIRTYSWASDTFPSVDERGRSEALRRRAGLVGAAVCVDDRLPLSGWPAVRPDIDDAEQGVFVEALLAVLDETRAEGVDTVMSGDRGDVMTSGFVLRYTSLLRRRRWRWLADEIREQHREHDESVARIVARDVLGASLRMVLARRPGGGASRVAAVGAPAWVRVPTPTTGDVGFDERRAESWGYSRARRLELVQAPSIARNITWTDRLHARAGLGFADPWSDRRIAEYVLAIPQHQILRPGEADEKRLPRAAISSFIAGGDPITMAKSAPSALFEAGLRAAAPLVLEELFRNSRCSDEGLVDDARFRDAFRRFLVTSHVPAGLWPTVSLELWLRAHW